MTRRLFSVALLAWLVVLILGPLSNPVGSEHLTKPLAEKVSPLHRLLFMGHGYRFFAPDPGPSHLVEFELTLADGTKKEGVFPDAQGPMTFPRLNYHRWFMLSETIWSEHAMTPLPADVERQQKQLLELATQKALEGNRETASSIRAEVEKSKTDYARARQRIDTLVQQVAKGLLRIHGGEKIKLKLRERLIPYPADVRDGSRLTDTRFLSPQQPPVIGEFSRRELGMEMLPRRAVARSSDSPLPDRRMDVEPTEGQGGQP